MRGQGLPPLGGAKIAVDLADDLANSSAAEVRVLRLIARDHVAPLIGAGDGPETLAAIVLAEHQRVPLPVPEAKAPPWPSARLKFMLRTTPLASDENQPFGLSLTALQGARHGRRRGRPGVRKQQLREGGGMRAGWRSERQDCGCRDAYPANATDLATVAGLRATTPAPVIFEGHASAAPVARITQGFSCCRPIDRTRSTDPCSDREGLAGNRPQARPTDRR